MRLQRDSYAPKSCAFDAANVQFLRAHLCKSHPVLQHLVEALYEKVMFSMTPEAMEWAVRIPNTVAIIGLVLFAVAYILGKISKRK